ncbi:Metacaspase involved in regulation of apoptosis [Handroanthus impetiginosus]|uniref:Metacaspase involved in regulation of apoptosis n=1 Tax=Handroanthus impetiginosus TaxID=429701 RepID=A0A2G9HVA5_9LAMI|nr:Metacaspase involved in regulation of apoptosis [Handroanthus impetiginosus]
MASKRVCCRWCRKPSIVPLQAQTLRCPACNGFTPLQINRTPQPNGNDCLPNYASYSKTYLNRADFSRHNRPMVAGVIFPMQPQVRVSSAQGPKRALLCGITYKEHEQSLQGSVNDVMLMKKLLVERFRFPPTSIVVLTEEGDPSHIPTKANIRAALRWLVKGCQPGDSLVFHYSGHGSRVRDRDGDEKDGYDESLLPVDYQTEGRILDDELNATIVLPLPKGAVLHSIVDSCYCGTFLDLPNVCRIDRQGFYIWEDHRSHVAYKGTSGGLAVSVSSCDDDQNSGDTTVFTGDAMGALTFTFVQTLEQKPNLKYGDLLLTMHQKIHAAREKVALGSNERPPLQEPQLSSSHKFDIHSKPFTL